jgi:hypothetical protein
VLLGDRRADVSARRLADAVIGRSAAAVLGSFAALAGAISLSAMHSLPGA